jgi:glycosyltransferase involved in cell wall biosynthesis
VEIFRVRTSSFGRFSLPGRAIDYLTFYIAAARCLRRLVREGDVVVAKTDPPLISVFAEYIARRRGARLVNWVQDLFPEIAVALGVKQLDGRVGRWLQALRNGSFAKAEPSVVIGDRMADRLYAEGVPRSRVRVIHNWVDGDAIRPLGHDVNPLRKEWDLDGRFVVGYSGNLGRVHEYATILGAAERLRERMDIVFLFIGGGVLSRELQRECTERGLENVRFLPYQPRARLRESLGVCDAHLIVLRPEMEGLVVPSKFYGVMAAGRPVLFVGDTEGEIARMIDEAGAGIAVTTGDADALVKAVFTLEASPEERGLLGRNARTAFESLYARPKAFKRWESVLSAIPVADGSRAQGPMA